MGEAPGFKSKPVVLTSEKRGFQMDAARELHELTARFLAGFCPVGGASGSDAPALDPLLQLAAQPSGDWRFGSIITCATKADGFSRLLRLNWHLCSQRKGQDSTGCSKGAQRSDSRLFS